MTGPADVAESPTNPEDLKIISLARSAQARTAARQGACVRDTDGRTYAAASVQLAHLDLSALTVAVAMAVSSGAGGLEAAALAGDDGPTDDDLALLGDVSASGAVLWQVDPRGAVRARVDL